MSVDAEKLFVLGGGTRPKVPLYLMGDGQTFGVPLKAVNGILIENKR
jgi:hypothetical protein